MFKMLYLLAAFSFLIQNSIVFCAPRVNADIFSFASYYSDHMVLQRAPYKANIWGYAEDQSTISITFLQKQYKASAVKVYWSQKSVWNITLDPMLASTSPVNLSFTQTTSSGQQSTIQLNDVLFGDVWICSGQSNMKMSVEYAFNGTQEAQNAYKYNNIRVFTASLISSSTPTYDLLGIEQKWSVASEASIGNGPWSYFSATCWYFGKNVYEKVQVPIGLLVTCWGGTIIERWSSPEALKVCNTPKGSNDSNIWNSMVHPLLNMTIFGAVWYQGEQNTRYNYNLYNCTFPAMIDDWRYKWFEGTGGLTNPMFPFGFVQLANIAVENITTGVWPWLRLHQTADYGYVPNARQQNVFMGTAVDLVDNYVNDTIPSIVHPRYKADVGYRLSLGALNLAYNLKSVEYSAPRVSSISYSNSMATIKFVSDFPPIQLELHNRDGIDVCCDSKICLFDETTPWQSILGINLSGDTASFSLPSNCKQLMYVRYLWRQKPCEFKQCALYTVNSQLPVCPFLVAANQN